MKIGMRNFKTALAVSLCIIIFQVFNIGSPFYAAIAAIISMQSSVVDSFKTGKNRILGTFLGALVGLIFALIGPSNPLLIGIGIIIIISISNWLKWNKSITIAGVVFIAIMVNLNGKSPWVYSLNRITDTIIGIVLAVLINYFISPPIKVDKVLDHYHQLYSILLQRIKEHLCTGEKINLEELNKSIHLLESEFNDYKMEFKGIKGAILESSSIQNVFLQLNCILDHLKIINEIDGMQAHNKENCERACNILNCRVEPSDDVEDEISIVYNYHMSKILECLENISREQM